MNVRRVHLECTQSAPTVSSVSLNTHLKKTPNFSDITSHANTTTKYSSNIPHTRRDLEIKNPDNTDERVSPRMTNLRINTGAVCGINLQTSSVDTGEVSRLHYSAIPLY